MALMVLLLPGCAGDRQSYTPSETLPPPTPFSAGSAWNVPIPTSPVLDGRSTEVISYLAGGATPGVANLYQYGVPIYEADASTPRYSVNCLRDWGVCGLHQELVPVPLGAVPSPGSDGAMVVVDSVTRRSFEFYKAERRLDGGWQAAWGGVVDLDGPGTPGAAVGAGVSRLAGVVRATEIARGRIDHALVFSTDNACTGTYRYPASKTDGRSPRPDCIPEGARIQLHPDVDIDALGLPPAERAVAHALQTYGAYAIDNGGAHMAFIFENPTGEADPYSAAGLRWDYFAMDAIPWQSLRLLRQWNGG